MTEQTDYIEPPEQGVYPDVPMDTYHRWDACSQSQLKKLAESPAHLEAYRREAFDDTESLKLGRIIHFAILQPDLFDERFTVLGRCQATKGDGDQCTYNAKYVTADGMHLCGTHGSEEQHDDSIHVVKEKQMDVVERIRESVRNSDKVKDLIHVDGRKPEFSIVWEDTHWCDKHEKGEGERECDQCITCRARFDQYTDQIPGGAAVDVKSTSRGADWQSFRKQIGRHKYYWQEVFYRRGIEELGRDLDKFVFVAVETNEPFGVAPYMIDDKQALTDAEGTINDLLYEYRACMTNERFPYTPDKVRGISVPDWESDEMDRIRDEIASEFLPVIEQGGQDE